MHWMLNSPWDFDQMPDAAAGELNFLVYLFFLLQLFFFVVKQVMLLLPNFIHSKIFPDVDWCEFYIVKLRTECILNICELSFARMQIAFQSEKTCVSLELFVGRWWEKRATTHSVWNGLHSMEAVTTDLNFTIHKIEFKMKRRKSFQHLNILRPAMEMNRSKIILVETTTKTSSLCSERWEITEKSSFETPIILHHQRLNFRILEWFLNRMCTWLIKETNFTLEVSMIVTKRSRLHLHSSSNRFLDSLEKYLRKLLENEKRKKFSSFAVPKLLFSHNHA